MPTAQSTRISDHLSVAILIVLILPILALHETKLLCQSGGSEPLTVLSLKPILPPFKTQAAPTYTEAANEMVTSKVSGTSNVIWDPEKQITFADYDSHVPIIAAIGDTVHLSWGTSGGPWIAYDVSNDAGMHWSESRAIFGLPIGGYYLASNRMFASTVGVMNVWSRLDSNRDIVEFRRKKVEDVNWMVSKIIVSDSLTGINYNGFVKDSLVGFELNFVGSNRFALSRNFGDSWSLKKMALTGGGSYCLISGRLLTVQQIVIYHQRELVFNWSDNLGDTWSIPIPISSQDSITSYEQDIAGSDDGTAHVVWTDGKFGSIGGFNGTILYRRFQERDSSWTPEERLNPIPDGILPRIACQGNYVVVAWGNVETGKISFRLSIDKGFTFSDAESLGKGGDHSVSISKGLIHLTWFTVINGKAQLFYRRGKLPVTQVLTQQQSPRSFSLSQNYPNPFNGETMFQYDLPVRSFVTLKVYDLLGREVSSLVNEVKNPGSYSVHFNTSRVASGVYLCQLRSGIYFTTKKIVLVK